MKIIIFIMGIIWSGVCMAVDWIEIGDSNEKKYFYDLDSVKNTGKYKFEFWEKHTSKNLNEVTRVRVDCVDDRYTVLDVYIYQGGKVIDSAINESASITPPPGSVGSSIIERVCGFGLSKEFQRMNLPNKEDFNNDIDYQLAKFNSFGFQDYSPNESMMVEYFNLMEEVKNEKPIYKMFIKVLDGLQAIKIKYIHLKQ